MALELSRYEMILCITKTYQCVCQTSSDSGTLESVVLAYLTYMTPRIWHATSTGSDQTSRMPGLFYIFVDNQFLKVLSSLLNIRHKNIIHYISCWVVVHIILCYKQTGVSPKVRHENICFHFKKICTYARRDKMPHFIPELIPWTRVLGTLLHSLLHYVLTAMFRKKHPEANYFVISHKIWTHTS